MPNVVSFTAPRKVALIACEPQPMLPGSVRVRTWYSGVSAGTELTAYRGSNPYLTRTWDADSGLRSGSADLRLPGEGWGYSEVGEVVEVADGVDGAAGRSCTASGVTAARPWSRPTPSAGGSRR